MHVDKEGAAPTVRASTITPAARADDSLQSRSDLGTYSRWPFVGTREPFSDRGEGVKFKIKFYYVTLCTLTFTPPLEIVPIVNAI